MRLCKQAVGTWSDFVGAKYETLLLCHSEEKDLSIKGCNKKTPDPEQKSLQKSRSPN